MSNMSKKKQWAVGMQADDGRYDGPYDTIEEAHKAAKEDWGVQSGEEYFIGEVVPIDREWLLKNIRIFDIDSLFESCEEAMAEGQAESWLQPLTHQHEKEIEAKVLDMIIEICPLGQFLVEEPERFVMP